MRRSFSIFGLLLFITVIGLTACAHEDDTTQNCQHRGPPPGGMRRGFPEMGNGPSGLMGMGPSMMGGFGGHQRMGQQRLGRPPGNGECAPPAPRKDDASGKERHLPAPQAHNEPEINPSDITMTESK